MPEKITLEDLELTDEEMEIFRDGAVEALSIPEEKEDDAQPTD